MIESYFSINTEKKGEYKTIEEYDHIWDDMKLLEFNISKLRKYKEGRRVLEFINHS
jgi:ubiquinone biosynthesis protein Coq4